MSAPAVHMPVAPGFRCVTCGKPTPCPDSIEGKDAARCHCDEREEFCEYCGCCPHMPTTGKWGDCDVRNAPYGMRCPEPSCGCEGQGIAPDVDAIREERLKELGGVR